MVPNEIQAEHRIGQALNIVQLWLPEMAGCRSEAVIVAR
jgi:hypothetical protein